MKANELRIGNFVNHYSEWSYRQPDNGPYENFDFQWEERDWLGVGESCLELDKIEPIPLTEDWILGFGFHKWGRDDLPRTLSYSIDWVKIFPPNSFSDFVGYGFMYYKPDPDKSTESARVKIEYVHQLQNLYFALTGHELTIQPNEQIN